MPGCNGRDDRQARFPRKDAIITLDPDALILHQADICLRATIASAIRSNRWGITAITVAGLFGASATSSDVAAIWHSGSDEGCRLMTQY